MAVKPNSPYLIGTIVTIVLAFTMDRISLEGRLSNVTTVASLTKQQLDRMEAKLDMIIEGNNAR
jgi:hypothetical protein